MEVKTLVKLCLVNSLALAEGLVPAAPSAPSELVQRAPVPVGPAVNSLLILAGSAWQEDSARLWAALQAGGVDQRHRMQCLRELAQRRDNALPEYLAQQLAAELHAGPQADASWQEALLLAAERTQFVDAALRSKVQELLLEHARLLREHTGGRAQQPLWTALRRYATMIPATRVGDFLEFLRDADAPLTRQVALQGIQSVFSLMPPAAGLAVAPLRERVHALALHYLQPERTNTSENRTLAVNAFRAALALDDPDAPALLEALVQLREPHMLWLSQGPLQRMAQSWAAQVQPQPDAAYALQRLRTCLAGLQSALEASRPVSAV